MQSKRGFTLLELIVATAILSILTMMALPLARITIKRQKEKELRRELWEMRDAIDRYKDFGRVAQALRSPTPNSLWVPRPRAFCEGGYHGRLQRRF